MNGLLDTHSFLWLAQNSAKLPASVRSVIEDPTNEIRISIASFWEIGIKASLGKLPLTGGSLLGLEAGAQAQAIEIVPLTVQAIQYMMQMPMHHKHPFGRLLAATAITSGDVFLSADSAFDLYGVKRFWADA